MGKTTVSPFAHVPAYTPFLPACVPSLQVSACVFSSCSVCISHCFHGRSQLLSPVKPTGLPSVSLWHFPPHRPVHSLTLQTLEVCGCPPGGPPVQRSGGCVLPLAMAFSWDSHPGRRARARRPEVDNGIVLGPCTQRLVAARFLLLLLEMVALVLVQVILLVLPSS